MTIELQASKRSAIGKVTKQLRAAGVIPGIVYGHNQQSLPIQCPLTQFLSVWKEVGSSSLVNLTIDNEPMAVLIQNVQRDPRSDKVLHIDFYKVNLNETITTDIPLEFVGVSPAVKELGGILVKSLDHVEIECLPMHLVHTIAVDLGRLATFDDAVLVRDLVVPSTVKICTHAEEVIATVQPPRSEEELKELETTTEATAVEGVEVAKKGKEHEEESTPSDNNAAQ